MQFPIPSWTSIIATTSADVSSLQTYINPVLFWILAAIFVLGIAGWAIRSFMHLVNR